MEKFCNRFLLLHALTPVSFVNTIVVVIVFIHKGRVWLNKKGFIRKTKQREVILQVLRSTKCHPTADWIYQEVRKELPNISLGTIYRNLKTLTEMGEILELSYGSTYSRFDGNADNHYHFVCEECGNVYDVDLPVNESINAKLEDKYDVQVNSHRLEFYGTCRECSDARTAEREHEMAVSN
ncbi:MAG TPA: transcriptional repressor [Firmicutes bacterium]|jgi:Fur family peroxide stress response transcriptional regulator|nr:transcriptional repressor [Bacillota bacterium]